MNKHLPLAEASRTFLLSDLIGLAAMVSGKKVGKLSDIVATEANKTPEVTHFLISRPFGRRSLMIPWERIGYIGEGAVALDVESLAPFEGEPGPGQLCLKDHLLDKKVLDCNDDEVDVAFDIKLTLRGGELHVTNVDCSRAAFLRRIGLGGIVGLVQKIAARMTDETIPWTYVQPLSTDIGSFRGEVKLNVLKAKLHEIHPVDLADILEELSHGERMALFHHLETEHASDTLEEIEPRVQRELIAALSKERAAELIEDMTPAQAADVLAILPTSDAEAILDKLDAPASSKIRSLIENHDKNILDLTTARYIAFPPDVTVAKAIQSFKDAAKYADVVMYIYVIDPENHLLGVVDVGELLQAGFDETLGNIMTTNFVSLSETDTVSAAYRLFARYSFRAIPVVGEGNIMKGAIPYRDIMNLSHRSL
jgi:CBS domain-containing protein